MSEKDHIIIQQIKKNIQLLYSKRNNASTKGQIEQLNAEIFSQENYYHLIINRIGI